MHANEEGAEKEEKSQADSMLSTEPQMEFNFTNHEIMTWAEIKSQTLNWVSHPGILPTKLFIIVT